MLAHSFRADYEDHIGSADSKIQADVRDTTIIAVPADFATDLTGNLP
jgi:hypothetical protein